MITLKDFMEVVNYRITEGSEYCWNCFGSNPYSLSSWNGENDGWSVNIVFDTGDQTVYVAEVCDYKNNRAYRLLNQDWAEAYKTYAEDKNPYQADVAWDDVKYTDLASDSDFLEKAQGIVAGVEYDTRVQMEIDLDDETILELSLEAHRRDITLNQMIEVVLKNAMDMRSKTLDRVGDLC